MEQDAELGLFLSVDELALIASRYKKMEEQLDHKERELLLRMEAVLYKHLSIDEMEELYSHE